MALPASPTNSTITAYGAQFREPTISRNEQKWIQIWAMMVLLNHAGGTNYLSSFGTLKQDAAALTAGMSKEEIHAALVGTYAQEASVIDPTNFPAVTSLSTLSTIIAKLPKTSVQTDDEWERIHMLLSYQLLRLQAA